MSEKIELTPTAFSVFETLSKAPILNGFPTMEYNFLRTKSGIKNTTFPKLIQDLNSKGLIQCRGPRWKRIVTLTGNPKRVIEVLKYSKKSEHSKPVSENQHKVRDCLKCRKKFDSEWPGERICKDCKSSAEWRAA